MKTADLIQSNIDAFILDDLAFLEIFPISLNTMLSKKCHTRLAGQVSAIIFLVVKMFVRGLFSLALSIYIYI